MGEPAGIPELKPCPFCGAKPMIEDMREGADDVEITCTNLKCRAIISVYEETEEKTIAAWNTRPIEAKAEFERDLLVGALKAVSKIKDGPCWCRFDPSMGVGFHTEGCKEARSALQRVGSGLTEVQK